MASAMLRATMSVGPPAANGTTMVTGRVGYCWANAAPLARASVATAPSDTKN